MSVKSEASAYGISMPRGAGGKAGSFQNACISQEWAADITAQLWS